MINLTLTQARKQFTGLWDTELLNDAEKTYSEVKALIPATTLTVKVRTFDNDIDELSHIDIAVQHEPFLITVSWSTQFKQYNVSAEPRYGFNNIEYIKSIKKDFTEPVTMRKLSLKKLNDWIDYRNAVYAALKVKNDIAANAITEFRNELKQAENAGMVVKYWDADRQGYVEHNNLRLDFTIHNTGVNQKVSFIKTPTLKDFIKF